MSPIFKSLLRIIIGIFGLWLFVYILIFRPIPVISKPVNNPIQPEILKEHVLKLSETFAPRSIDHPENLKKVGLYIKEEFLKYTKFVDIQKFNVEEDSYFNVIGKFGNLESDTIILIGAHYDGFSSLPAADDNASGIAGLLELARLLPSIKTDHQIHVVAYTNEEPPFFATKYMGSNIHAESITDKEKIELMINLEMIGYYSNKEGSQEYPLKVLNYILPTKGNFISIVEKFEDDNARKLKYIINKNTNIEAYSMSAFSNMPGLSHSDHRNYWDEDIPAIMVTNTAHYRNEFYHTKYDTYDRLDYNKMAEVVYGVYLYLDNY